MTFGRSTREESPGHTHDACHAHESLATMSPQPTTLRGMEVRWETSDVVLGRRKLEPRILSSLTPGKWRRPRAFTSHGPDNLLSVLLKSGGTNMVHPVAVNFAKNCCHLFAGRRGVQLIGVVSARGCLLSLSPLVLMTHFAITMPFTLEIEHNSARYITDSNGPSSTPSKAWLEC